MILVETNRSLLVLSFTADVWFNRLIHDYYYYSYNNYDDDDDITAGK